MPNLTAQGLKEQVTQWFTRLPQFREIFSTVKDVYGDLLGVDLDDSSIISILLRSTLGIVRVIRAEVAGLSSGGIVDDAIADNALVAMTIKKMVSKAGIQTAHAVLGMPGSKVVIKRIKLDARLSDAEAEARAWQEARKTFPEIAKSLYLDFEQIEETGIDKNKKIILVLVAVRKEDVTPRVDVLHQAGLITKIVDVDYYALERVYLLLASQLPRNHAAKYVAMIDFNPHSIVFVVMHEKKMVYGNRQGYTGDALVPIVQHALGVEIAEPTKNKSVVLPSLRASLTPTPAQSEVRPSLTFNSLTDEQKSHLVMSIRRLFQSFYTENVGKIIDQIVMTGRCALIADLTLYIEKMLDIPTIIGNPFASLKMSEHVDSERLLKLGPAFALSCGLAMRGIPVWT